MTIMIIVGDYSGNQMLCEVFGISSGLYIYIVGTSYSIRVSRASGVITGLGNN